MSGQAPNLRVPAEWESQSCIWLAWPHNSDTWPGRYENIPSIFARWIATIAESVPVRVLASGLHVKQCAALVGNVNHVEIIDIATNDCWVRDYGPTFVVNEAMGSQQAVNWQYNAWGGKYPPWEDDNAAAKLIARHASIPCADSRLCLEGGAIEVDGSGRLMTTSACLLTETRNPGWTKDQIESELRLRLGVNEILWLTGGGLVGDDTDGHIDQLARFIDPENIVAAVCNDSNDPNYEPLSANLRQLRTWATSTSPNITIHEIPIPPARHINGQRVPESYCNFLRLGSDRCQVPSYGATSDDLAIDILANLTSTKVESIDCRDLVWGLGALHCASRDQPLQPSHRLLV